MIHGFIRLPTLQFYLAAYKFCTRFVMNNEILNEWEISFSLSSSTQKYIKYLVLHRTNQHLTQTMQIISCYFGEWSQRCRACDCITSGTTINFLLVFIMRQPCTSRAYECLGNQRNMLD